MLVIAGADICPPAFDQLGAEIVVEGQPVTLGNRLGDAKAHPCDVLFDHLVRFGIDPFWIGILDAQDIPAPVLPDIGIVERCGTGMTDMQRA